MIEEGLDLLVVLGGLFDDGFEGAGKGGDSYLGYALATALRQTFGEGHWRQLGAKRGGDEPGVSGGDPLRSAPRRPGAVLVPAVLADCRPLGVLPTPSSEAIGIEVDEIESSVSRYGLLLLKLLLKGRSFRRPTRYTHSKKSKFPLACA